jgi:hypothetical protein
MAEPENNAVVATPASINFLMTFPTCASQPHVPAAGNFQHNWQEGKMLLRRGHTPPKFRPAIAVLPVLHVSRQNVRTWADPAGFHERERHIPHRRARSWPATDPPRRCSDEQRLGTARIPASHRHGG